jgi:hypothetical protein
MTAEKHQTLNLDNSFCSIFKAFRLGSTKPAQHKLDLNQGFQEISP